MGISFWGEGVGNQRPRGKTARHSLPKDFWLRDKAKKISSDKSEGGWQIIEVWSGVIMILSSFLYSFAFLVLP